MIREPDAAAFPTLTDEQVEQLSRYGTERHLETGEYLFRERDLVDSFYVVLEGEISILRVGSDGSEEFVGTHRPGGFTGQLAAVAGRTTRARARAVVPSRVLEITADAFRNVAAENPEVADIFISTLARRMRQTQAWIRQQEKLAALGKLSAGLAHELNNPAAAAQRAAQELRGAAIKAQLVALEHDERLSAEGRVALATLQREAEQNGAVLDPLARSDREEEIAEWLEVRGFEDAWDLAPTLAAVDLDTERLDRLDDDLGGDRPALAGGLQWLGATLELTGLANEVGRSVARISELVSAMKEYTYMDRTAFVETDVRVGLENTLTILGHKLKGVAVEREYEEDLPKIWANAGELNQVWTNLIDNAAAAAGAQGRIRVRALQDGERVRVEIIDNGPGIPREIRNRIFEPFFTTKEIGEGTGLGLDTVRRIVAGHGGEVTFDSGAGETRFTVRLPIKKSNSEGG